MIGTGARNRFLMLFVLGVAFVSILLLSSYREPPGGRQPPPIVPGKDSESNYNGASLTGHAIAPKLGNATAKYACLRSKHTRATASGNEVIWLTFPPRRAELGRAAWKVLHTTFARFPEKPSDDEKEALRSFVHLFQRLYPWYAPLITITTGVMRSLTVFAAESAPSTSERCWPNTLPRSRHVRRQPCGAAMCTISSIRGWISPSSTARTSGMHTTVDAETKTRKTRAGMPRRTPDRGAIRAEVEKRPDKANVQEADGAFTTFCRMGLHPWQKASG